MFEGKTVTAIIVAAGRSARMGFDKLFYPVGGSTVLRLAVGRLDAHPAIDHLVVVGGENIDKVRELFAEDPPQKPLTVVAGGALRTDSVLAGLAACEDAGLVAIHDGARPFVPQALITSVLRAALAAGAAAPALPLKDTVKTAEGDFVAATLPRETLRAIQTPQIFARAAFVQALAAIPPVEYATLTDDCMVMERAGHPVRLVPGEEENRKITTPQDLRFLAQSTAPALRVGHGYDVHRLVAGRPLVLGGVRVPWEKGLLGHSDADVLLHAVCDALLGAAALGDIGQHFPDSDPAYAGADSLQLLARVGRLLLEKNCAVSNLDATILCQRPKLAPHIPAMRQNIAAALGMEVEAVSVKATTEEGLGFTGTGEGIAAHCVALLARHTL